MSYLIVKWNRLWQEVLRVNGPLGRRRSLRLTGLSWNEGLCRRRRNV